MQIIHMPSGVHAFADFGYERYPFHPIAGEETVIQAMLENAGEMRSARLLWEVNGAQMEPATGFQIERPGDDRLFVRFKLRAFDEAVSVCYRIEIVDAAGVHASKPYHFDVLKKEALGEPTGIYADETGLSAAFARLHLRFDRQDGLKLEWLDGANQADLPQQPKGAQALQDGFEMAWQSGPFIWELKRFSKTLIQWHPAQTALLVNAKGQVCAIERRVDLTAKHVTGLGERFDTVEQREERLLRVVEHYAHQGENTYLPIPFFTTESGVGWFSPSSRRMRMDFEKGFKLWAQVGLGEKTLFTEHWLTGTRLEILSKLHLLTGRAALPPKWALGIWMSSNGWSTQKETLAQLDALKEHGLPATALVLEAWSDENTFYIFNDARYTVNTGADAFTYQDFSFDADSKWPDPKAMAQAVESAGIKLVLWQIPVIKYERGACRQHQNDERYAIEKGFCVMNDDGTPYRITDNWFRGSLLLDFTNPEAVKWWFSKRAYLLDDLKVAGFKTDGGEFLFDDTARLYNGQSGETAHNDYPMQYVGAYHAFMQAHGVNGVTFSRAGYTGAQQFPMHWAGDQLSEWSEFRAQLTAGLTAGLSGIPFWTFDIGGFSGDFPSKELYSRSVAMAAFSPVMQWHSEPRNGQFFYTDRARWNNDRSPWNLADLYNDPELLALYRLYSNLRMNLTPYLYNEARFCVQTARPMMAHLMLDYPEDEVASGIHDAYMLGRELLVAPVMAEGLKARRVYLPEGIWHSLFTGGTYTGGTWIEVACPLDRLPVFVRDGAVLPINLGASNVMGSCGRDGGVGSGLTGYERLTFVLFGDAACDFEDDLGVRLRVEKGRVSGKGIARVTLVNALEAGQDITLFSRGVRAWDEEVMRDAKE